MASGTGKYCRQHCGIPGPASNLSCYSKLRENKGVRPAEKRISQSQGRNVSLFYLFIYLMGQGLTMYPWLAWNPKICHWPLPPTGVHPHAQPLRTTQLPCFVSISRWFVFFLRFIFISALVHEHVCMSMGGGAEIPIRTHQTPWS